MPKTFFQKVWLIVSRIPRGKVVSYGWIAALLGNPRSARTVGWALHSTPKELDIPWHRVINSRGQISYDRGEHGPSLQRVMLEQEGVIFDNDRVDMSVYQWLPNDVEMGELLDLLKQSDFSAL